MIALTPLPEGISSNIAAHGYDIGSRTLAVRFKSGAVYHYKNVEPQVASDFASADSMGKFLAANIKSAYEAEKQDEDVSGD